MIPFSCPRCNAVYQYPDEMAGQKIRCTGPNCTQKLLIPAPAPSMRSFPSGEAARVKVQSTAQARKTTAAMARPRDDSEEASPPASGSRAFESLGIGVYAIVCAIILVGLFAVLFPLMRPRPTPPTQNTASVVSNGDSSKVAEQQPAVRSKTPQEVIAQWKPSVALVKNRSGSGSGFFVGSDFVVTNSHVVSDDIVAGIEVTFPSSDNKGERYKARLVYEDRSRDLAILQLQSSPHVSSLPLSMAKLAEGQDIVSIGSPGVLGVEGGVSINSAVPGHINNLDFRYKKEDLVYILHDAAVNPGNSGGPILNLRGEVVGVNVAIAKRSDGKEMPGGNLAIPGIDLTAALKKANNRNPHEIERATALHDAHAAFGRLAKASDVYNRGMNVLIQAVRNSLKEGGSARQGVQIARKAIAQAQQQNAREIIDPLLAHRIYVDPIVADLANLLLSSELDDGLRRKLREFREAYFKLRGLYETPSGTIDAVESRLNETVTELIKQAKTLRAEFGTVF